MRSLVTENSIKFGLGSRIRSRICRKEFAFPRFAEGGTTTNLEVLDAQCSLYGAELTLAAARGDEYRSLGRLYKALGGGWQQ